MDDVMTELTGILRDVLGQPDLVLRPETTASEVPGWDSVAMVEVLMVLEERLGVRFTSRDLDHLANVGDMAALVRTRRPG